MTTTPPLLLKFPTPAQRRLLAGPRSVTYAGLTVQRVAVCVHHCQVAVIVSTSAGHTVDLALSPADATELGAALLSHAEWAAAR